MMKKRTGLEISHCARLIRRYMDTRAVKSYIDEMTGTHGYAVRYFYQNRDRDVFQKDFEKEFDIRRSTASNILSLMEKNGLIRREAVAHDARLKKIILTQKAADIHHKVEQTLCKMEQDIVRDISEKELDAFFETLDKIKNNLERMTLEND